MSDTQHALGHYCIYEMIGKIDTVIFVVRFNAYTDYPSNLYFSLNCRPQMNIYESATLLCT